MERFVIRQTLSTIGLRSKSPPIQQSVGGSKNCFSTKQPSSRNTTTITKGNNASTSRLPPWALRDVRSSRLGVIRAWKKQQVSKDRCVAPSFV